MLYSFFGGLWKLSLGLRKTFTSIIGLFTTFSTLGKCAKTSESVQVSFVKFITKFAFKARLTKFEYRKTVGKIRCSLSYNTPARLIDYRITGLADFSCCHCPYYVLQVQFRWNNPSLSLDDAQDTFEQWMRDSNLQRKAGASGIHIEKLLYA
mmetsp:Transcript_12746/g.17708  ORF Transcript_12746/g.17708 Transcript_12746/m.17708 type:complete len:152 (-) Transcript_12746:569-1024(-)